MLCGCWDAMQDFVRYMMVALTVGEPRECGRFPVSGVVSKKETGAYKR